MWWRVATVGSVLIVVFVLSGWAKVLPPKDVEFPAKSGLADSPKSVPVLDYANSVEDKLAVIDTGRIVSRKRWGERNHVAMILPAAFSDADYGVGWCRTAVQVRRDQVALCGRGHQRSCGGTIFGALGGILRVSDSTIHKYQLPYEEERLEYGYDSEPQRIFCKLTGICSQPVLIGGTLPTLAFYTLGIGLGGVAGWACANVRYYLGGSLLILGILIAWCGVLLPW